jgi:hypothetical protein
LELLQIGRVSNGHDPEYAFETVAYGNIGIRSDGIAITGIPEMTGVGMQDIYYIYTIRNPSVQRVSSLE